MRVAIACAVAVWVASVVCSAAPSDGEADFRAIYKELIETNTTLSAGSCTLAAEKMAARLKAAGYRDADMHLFSTPDHPKEGGLVAILAGADPSAKAVLLLAHVDVVEAKRSDWGRDPFTLFEENGYFYGRGAADNKSMVAMFTDLMSRFKREGYRPKHAIKLALTCGEETQGAFNGAKYLVAEHRDWIDAGIALNEGGAGELDANGNRVAFDVEAGEKVYQDYTLTATNAGGHSSRPRPDNAIYEMAAALQKIGAYEFPVMLNDATRGYFSEQSKLKTGATAKAMADIVSNPQDKAAAIELSKDAMWHSMLRTTCVATLIDGGHAKNALPQKVTANVNCRLFPGMSPEAVLETLTRVADDAKLSIEMTGPRSPATPAPALGPDVLGPVKAAAAAVYPGVPVVPMMTTWATDGIYTTAAGIQTYGIQGYFNDPDQGNMHGLNERIRVKSLMNARVFHYLLVKRLAEQ